MCCNAFAPTLGSTNSPKTITACQILLMAIFLQHWAAQYEHLHYTRSWDKVLGEECHPYFQWAAIYSNKISKIPLHPQHNIWLPGHRQRAKKDPLGPSQDQRAYKDCQQIHLQSVESWLSWHRCRNWAEPSDDSLSCSRDGDVLPIHD